MNIESFTGLQAPLGLCIGQSGMDRLVSLSSYEAIFSLMTIYGYAVRNCNPVLNCFSYCNPVTIIILKMLIA